MDLENISGFSLRGLSTKNVVLGKNGCGKSHLLKHFSQQLQGTAGYGLLRYISPERGGFLSYEPGIEQAIATSADWIRNQRNSNQSNNFRQQSVALLKRLELMVLREIEQEHVRPGYVPKNFGSTLDLLNTLLDRVRLEREDMKGFKIVDKQSGQTINESIVSSGESELISLGIEFLSFAKEAVTGSENILLVDEPDVHLHPDLQARLAKFILQCLRDKPIRLILATHSTPLLAGLAEDPDTRVAFMKSGDTVLNFSPVSVVEKAILPIFGAHPLSNIFNQSPILLVEGEDDERIWQQAIRSARGRIKLFPCVVEDGITGLTAYETKVNLIIEAVYDDATGYSLRDRDLNPELIDDVGRVKRMRLSCRAAENLLLSDDVLQTAGIDWNTMKERIDAWLAVNSTHQYFAEMRQFVDTGCDRKGHDLKSIRNILVGLISNKAWEILVGQTIARIATENTISTSPDSLCSYLGEKICRELLGLVPPQLA